MTQYRLAPEVANIASALIADHHRDLVENGFVRIEYIFRDEAAVSKGREVWGKARKISGLNAFLSRIETGHIGPEDPEAYFVIEIAEDVWNVLSHRQKVALVDHELSHLSVQIDAKDEDKTALVIRGHDLEEFVSVVQRHGLWRADVEHFAKVGAEQLSLLDAPGAPYDDETGIGAAAEKYLAEDE